MKRAFYLLLSACCLTTCADTIVNGPPSEILSDEYIFSADGATVGSKPRELPSQGYDRATGRVVIGLHNRTDEEKAACGWWRIVLVARPEARSNEVWRVTGYTFADSHARQVWTCSWRKVKPVKYSRLSIYLMLRDIAKWEAAEAYMKAHGLYEPFMFAQEISSDHPLFAAAKSQVAAALGLTEEQIDELLKECVLK